jgi:hypothetical protein
LLEEKVAGSFAIIISRCLDVADISARVYFVLSLYQYPNLILQMDRAKDSRASHFNNNERGLQTIKWILTFNILSVDLPWGRVALASPTLAFKACLAALEFSSDLSDDVQHIRLSA